MTVEEVMCKVCDRCKFTYMCADEDELYTQCSSCPIEADIKVLIAAAQVTGRLKAAEYIINESVSKTFAK